MSDQEQPPAGFSWQNVDPPVEGLRYRLLMPDGWRDATPPAEAVDFANPTAFFPLGVFMTPYAPIVFSIAGRPAYDDGTREQWLRYLCSEQGIEVSGCSAGMLSGTDAVFADASQQTEAGPMKIRIGLFAVDGKLLTVTALAPEPLWGSVAQTFERMEGSFVVIGK